ncbi:MAG: DUF177 domain-containing protein [Thermoflexaceae bacterium]|nr:DUF177 domain-containing protein [Thermoflexaceae bacterium]
MQFNVSQLLREPVGATRRYELDPEPPVHRGTVELMRTPAGVLVRCSVDVVLDAACSRCLAPFGDPRRVSFEEVYHQQVDVVTGARLDTHPDQDSFLIDTNHTIDITEGVRQYSEMAAAMQPLCRPDCPGICPVCGQDLSIVACDCDRTPADARWGALAELMRSRNG